MHNDDVEPWPFVDEPPPLEVRRRGSETNTASQTGSQQPPAIPPLEKVTRGSEAPQIASETPSPPPLQVIKENGKPVEPSPPPLQVVRRGNESPAPAVEIPPLEITLPSDYVYMVIGFNRDQDAVHLARVITNKEYQKHARLGEKNVKEFLFTIFRDDVELMCTERGNEELANRKYHTSLTEVPVIPQHARRGVVFRADLTDTGEGIHDPNYDEDEDEDDDGERRREMGATADPYVVYSWAVIRYKISETVRLNLTSILDQ